MRAGRDAACWLVLMSYLITSGDIAGNKAGATR
jgi:hypothetical protein